MGEFRVVETNELVGVLCWRWGRKRAARIAASFNAQRAQPSLRYAVQEMGWGRWRVIALQNRLNPVEATETKQKEKR